MTFEPNEESQNLQPDPPIEADGSVAPTVAKPGFSRADILAALLLVAIIAVGGYLRHVGYNWDDSTPLHPDERFLTGITQAIGGSLNPTGPQNDQDHQKAVCQERYPTTGGAADSIFDSQCSTYYPKNAGNGLYVYGELPLFIVKFTAGAPPNPGPRPEAQIGAAAAPPPHYHTPQKKTRPQ